MLPSNISAFVKRSATSLLFFMLGIPALLFGETVGLFYDSAAPQESFAAGDVKSALESKGYTVDLQPLTTLSSAYANKKVIIALASDSSVTSLLTGQGGSIPSGLSEQAYALRTTTQGQASFWALGGDHNGTMYGGLQLAENIKFDGFTGNYQSQESPTILKRGIKLNLPLDAKAPTYDGSNKGSSYLNAITNVWDMTFWTTWFDEMARNRYNVVSVWNMNPFTSLVHLPDYPNVTIQNVTGYNSSGNEVLIKTMTIDEKIAFWRQVMAYAHARGFEFLFFNWNVWLSNANGQYGLANESTSSANSTYFYKSMLKLLETYPDLDGFGLTKGEHGGTEQFLWDAYGKAMRDHAAANPARKLRLIIRWFEVDINLVNSLFSSLRNLSNVNLDLSYKYCLAHLYTTTNPGYWTSSHASNLTSNGYKTWFTIRNDDLYYHNWGDPSYARAYINGLPGQGDYLRGFYMGSDGYSQTRTFLSKNSVTQGTLDIQRQGYMYKLWGRLSYNPNTPDAVFQNYMAVKYPEVSSADLFTAWSKASSGLPKASEIVYGTFQRDFNWWPEACWKGSGPYVNITEYANAVPRPNSSLCSIASSATGGCSGKKTSYQLADEMETDALAALSIVGGMPAAEANTELGVALNNIRAMSYLSLYYAYKIRGATYLKAGSANKTAALGSAYCYWMQYSNLMDSMYTGMSNQRVANLQNWHQPDSLVLGDYTSNGGSGTPSCSSGPLVSISATDATASEPADNGTYTFTRTGSTSAALTVNYTVSGTATSGSDYAALGTSVTIAAGQASATKTLAVMDDFTPESPETVMVNLSSGTGYTIGSPGSATVTIADNEPPLPMVTVAATLAATSENPSPSGLYTFTRTGGTTSALTVNYAVSGTATSDADYTSIGTAVTIPVGQASATATVAIIDDLALESPETVIVTLASNADYTVGSPNSATVTIADNEVPVGEAAPWTETFTYANGTTSHGTPTTWTATNISVQNNEMSFNNVGADGVLTTGAINISSGPVTVSLKVRGGSGLDVGQDFLRLYKKVDGGAEVQIGAADGPQAAATWTANITTGSSLVLVVRAHVTSTTEFYYFDDLSITATGAPVLPTVTVAATTATAAEPSTNGVYTFTRTGSTAAALTVDYAVTGTATSGTDYTSIGTSVTIPVGQASATKAVAVLSDAIAENAETVIVTLASNTAYIIGAANSATVTIADAPPDTGLPSPWVTADIGGVAAVGSATYSDPIFTIKGSGADILGTADEFRYVSQTSTGECAIVARVASIQNTHGWAKSGVMIREGTAAGSVNIFVFVTPTNGVGLTWRSSANGTTTNTTPAVAGQTAPKWLKLTRVGTGVAGVFTASRSDDGITWVQIGTPQTISMNLTATLGLAVTSHADGTLCTSTMDNVTATP